MGPIDPEIQTWRRFLYNAPTHQVSSSLSFRKYCVEKQTNEEIQLKTSTLLRYATPVEKKQTTQYNRSERKNYRVY